MGRAIMAISGSAAALLPNPFAGMFRAFGTLWYQMTRDITRPYRPERHYMRGPGPAWKARYGDLPQG